MIRGRKIFKLPQFKCIPVGFVSQIKRGHFTAPSFLDSAPSVHFHPIDNNSILYDIGLRYKHAVARDLLERDFDGLQGIIFGTDWVCSQTE